MVSKKGEIVENSTEKFYPTKPGWYWFEPSTEVNSEQYQYPEYLTKYNIQENTLSLVSLDAYTILGPVLSFEEVNKLIDTNKKLKQLLEKCEDAIDTALIEVQMDQEHSDYPSPYTYRLIAEYSALIKEIQTTLDAL